MTHFHSRAVKPPHQGFTLVEILVVIAIVSLLAGLLFSAFASVRNSARASSCASNLKQIGLAIAMYASDNRGRYPNNERAFGLAYSTCAWADLLLPYTRTPSVFVCPSARNMPYVPGCPPDSTLDIDDFKGQQKYDGAYSMNTLSSYRFLSEANFKHPATTISVLDGTGAFIQPAFQSDPPVEEQVATIKLPRHRGGNNVLFLDGHVKWLSTEALKDPALYAIGSTTM